MTQTLGELADEHGWPTVALYLLNQRNLALKVAVAAGADEKVLLGELARVKAEVIQQVGGRGSGSRCSSCGATETYQRERANDAEMREGRLKTELASEKEGRRHERRQAESSNRLLLERIAELERDSLDRAA